MNKIIAVDFDGTLCENKWPEIGNANKALFSFLIYQKEKCGAKIVLWTCRTGKELEEAVRFCEEKGLQLDAVNENLPEVIEWMRGDSRKIYADEYIDDRAINIKYADEKQEDVFIGMILKDMGVDRTQQPHWIPKIYKSKAIHGGEMIEGYTCSYCGKYSYSKKAICDGCNKKMEGSAE